MSFLAGYLLGGLSASGALMDVTFWKFISPLLLLWVGLLVIWKACQWRFVTLAGRSPWDDDVAVRWTWRVFFFAYCPMWAAVTWKIIT